MTPPGRQALVGGRGEGKQGRRNGAKEENEEIKKERRRRRRRNEKERVKLGL